MQCTAIVFQVTDCCGSVSSHFPAWTAEWDHAAVAALTADSSQSDHAGQNCKEVICVSVQLAFFAKSALSIMGVLDIGHEYGLMYGVSRNMTYGCLLVSSNDYGRPTNCVQTEAYRMFTARAMSVRPIIGWQESFPWQTAANCSGPRLFHDEQ